MDITKLADSIIQQGLIWLPKLAAAIFIILFFLLLSKIVKRLILKVSANLKIDNDLTVFFARASRIILIILGLLTALGTIGINVSALIAGLGLTGFALGFAFKDTISNILSGILILIYQPFKVGDTIKVSGYEGKVISIDHRYTKLDAENSVVLIPNAKCFTDPVVVYSKTQ